MRDNLRRLFSRLDDVGVVFCHWKSNNQLAGALDGRGDLDLLVRATQRSEFETVLKDFGYKRGRFPAWADTPGTVHFYGLDRTSGGLIHLHVYFHLLTGGSILKNHKLPFETLALNRLEQTQPVPTPRKDVDLGMFVLRKTIEFASFAETLMLVREGEAVAEELAWLSAGDNLPKAADLVAQEIPEVDRDFFLQCAESLRHRRSLLSCMRLGRALTERLSRFAVLGRFRAAASRAYRLAMRLVYRAMKRHQLATLASGGAFVAIVGPDATGKSTVVEETQRWLGAELWVEKAHAGRPPGTWLTVIPHTVLPWLRRAAPSYRTTSIMLGPNENADAGKPPSLRGSQLWIFVVRSLMIAYERRALVRRMERKRARGAIVIFDRYPSVEPSNIDSPQLAARIHDANPNSILGYLVDLEKRAYRNMPAADLILRLTVPVDVAVMRNDNRVKAGKESESYIRMRHQDADRCLYRAPKEMKIDTSRPLDQTLREARTTIWNHL